MMNFMISVCLSIFLVISIDGWSIRSSSSLLSTSTSTLRKSQLYMKDYPKPNVAALLGTGLPSRPDVSSTSEPYLLGKDDKRKDVWNTESLRGALGI